MKLTIKNGKTPEDDVIRIRRRKSRGSLTIVYELESSFKVNDQNSPQNPKEKKQEICSPTRKKIVVASDYITTRENTMGYNTTYT